MRLDDSTPRGPGEQPVPFAAVPHALLADRRLAPNAKALAGILLRFARKRDHAWPSLRTLGALLGLGRRAVQLNLRRLKVTGWIGEEPAANRTGRILVLLWRRSGMVSPGPTARSAAEPAPRIAPPRPARPRPLTEPAPGCAAGGAQPAAPPPAHLAAPKQDVIVKQEENPEKSGSERPRRAEIATRANLTAAVAAADDPILRRELARREAPAAVPVPPPQSAWEAIERLGERPHDPPRLADWLAEALGDRRSYRGYLAKIQLVMAGHLPRAALADALRQATGPDVRSPGAVFMTALRRWESAPGRPNPIHRTRPQTGAARAPQ